MVYSIQYKISLLMGIRKDMCKGLQKEVDRVTDYLNGLYDSVYVIDKQGLEDLWDILRPVAGKIDQSYKDKICLIGTVNKALKLKTGWESFSIQKCGDKAKVYEVLREEASMLSLKDGVTSQGLMGFFKGKTEADIPSVYIYLFGTGVPNVLKTTKEQLSFVNYKFESSPGLEDKMVTINGKKGHKVLCFITRPNIC